MMLVEKLSSIDKPPIDKLKYGAVHSIQGLWNGLLSVYIHNPNIVIA